MNNCFVLLQTVLEGVILAHCLLMLCHTDTDLSYEQTLISIQWCVNWIAYYLLYLLYIIEIEEKEF
jgi:hypothetical protein